jgi:hypothetical protein
VKLKCYLKDRKDVKRKGLIQPRTFVFSASFGTSFFFICQSLGFFGFLGLLDKVVRCFFDCEELLSGSLSERLCLPVECEGPASSGPGRGEGLRGIGIVGRGVGVLEPGESIGMSSTGMLSAMKDSNSRA